MADLKRRRIGLMGATLETPNLGVSTLAVGAVSCMLHAYPGAELFFLDYEQQSMVRRVRVGTSTIDVPLVNMRFSKRFWLSNNIAVLIALACLRRIAPIRSMRRWIVKNNACMSAICSADMFGSVAGGDSFSDIYGWMRFVYVALPQILIVLLGKPLVLLPQTYGPFRGVWPRMVARWITSHAERAFCRDAQSLFKLMEKSGGEDGRRRYSFCPDIGFVIDPVRPSAIEIVGLQPECGERQLVGLNISGLLDHCGYTGNNEFGLCLNYRSLAEAIIESILSRSNTAILLVPHVYGAERSSESDVEACEQAWIRFCDLYPGRVGILRGRYDPNCIRYVIGSCRFFIGSRMHACIAAISQCVPSVAIAYSDKFRAVMQTVGLERLVADARTMSESEILILLDSAYQNKEGIARELAMRIPRMRQTILSALRPDPAKISVPPVSVVTA